jgi:hypothetical protein
VERLAERRRATQRKATEYKQRRCGDVARVMDVEVRASGGGRDEIVWRKRFGMFRES